MNILWVLDEDPVAAAAAMCDEHVVHAPYRCARLLGTLWNWYVKHPPHTPANWPTDKPFIPPNMDLEDQEVRWIMRGTGNMQWASAFAAEACHQYQLRFGKRPLYAATCGVLGKPPYALQRTNSASPMPYPVEVCRVAYAMLPNPHWRHTSEPPWLADYRR